MEKQFFILIGRSGSGKGTQAELLKTYLEKKGVPEVKHVTTGSGFRSFVEGDSYASLLARHINDTGKLQPEFLAIWNWSTIFINTLQGKETVILDGAPRKPLEVHVLNGAIEYFGYTSPTVIYIDVSETWAKDRLTFRGRSDDKIAEAQDRRMVWFMEQVLPCVDLYKQDSRVRFIHINGEKTVEEVHASIVEHLER